MANTHWNLRDDVLTTFGLDDCGKVRFEACCNKITVIGESTSLDSQSKLPNIKISQILITDWLKQMTQYLVEYTRRISAFVRNPKILDVIVASGQQNPITTLADFHQLIANEIDDMMAG